MTNEETIEILKGYKQRLENSCSNQLDEDIKAFDNAIEALGVCNKIKGIIEGWAVDDDEHVLLERIADIIDEEKENE